MMLPLFLLSSFATAQDIDISLLPEIEVAHVIPALEFFSEGNFDLPSDVIEETEVFVGLNAAVDFNEIGIFDADDFLCSDIFDFLQGETDNPVELDVRANCRICPEGNANNTRFFTLILPELLRKEVITIEPFFIPDPRMLQNELNINLTKFIRVKGTESIVELFELPSFDIESVHELNAESFVMIFTGAVQLIRGTATTETITVACRDVISRSDLNQEDCTLEFNDNLVIVSPTNYNDDAGLFPVGFPENNPSFFSAVEVFGLKQVSKQAVEVNRRPRLEFVQQNSANELRLFFDSPLSSRIIERIRCSQLFDLTLNSEFSLFAERPDLFCALNALGSSAVITFVDVIPFIPDSNVSFIENNFFVDDDGIGIAKANQFVIPITANFELYTLSLLATGPRDLSLCDSTILIEITLLDDSDLMRLNFELDVESSFIVQDGETDIAIPLDFCEFTFSTAVCDITKLTFFGDGVVDYELVFSANLIVIENTDEFNVNNFAPSNPVIITQDRGASKIPVTIAGINTEVTQTFKRGTAFSFTAVLGDVFGCANQVETSPIFFEWDISNENFTLEPQREGKFLFVTGNELPIGEYTVSLTARPSGEIGVEENTISFQLLIEPVDVIVISESGEQQTVSSEDDLLVLDALRSCNPNVADGQCQSGIGFVNRNGIEQLSVQEQLNELGFGQGFSVEWSCVDCGNLTDEVVFQGVDRQAPIVRVPLLNLIDDIEIAASFVFGFSVTNEVDLQENSVDVNVNVIVPPEQCVFPAVGVAPLDARINADQSVSIIGSVNPPPGEENAEFLFNWVEVTDANENVFESDDIALRRRILFIPANSLSEGARYDFSFSSFTAPCLENNDAFPQATVGFDVNRRPFGGVLSVNPTVGTALDTFVLTTANWADAEFDLPLTFAFELAYVAETDIDNIEEISDRDTIPLSQFTQSLTLATNLQVPPAGQRTLLIAVAKDALGAVSRRLITNANVDVIVENPFVDVNEINVGEIVQLIEDLQNTGDATQIPNLCSAVNSALNELSQEELDQAVDQGILLETDLTEIRQICFDAVVEQVFNDPNVQVDTDVVNLVASSISTITERVDQVDAQLLADADNQTAALVEEMERQVQAVLRGDEDPNVASIIPESFRQNIADTISNILGASELLFGENSQIDVPASRNGKKRRLQDNVDICDVLGAARDSVIGIGNLQTSVLAPGAPQVDADATNVHFAALRESINDIGEISNFIDIPDGQNGNNGITLPSNFAAELQRLNAGVDEDLNILAAKWDILIRCEERAVEEVQCSEEYDYDGPRDGREGTIVSLDFFPLETNQGQPLTVDDISEPIEIIIDLPPSLEDLINEDTDVVQECAANAEELSTVGREVEATFSEEIVCGFFDEETNDFITDFCEPAELILIDGVSKVRCRCNHATDYAAWSAFRYDVRTTLVSQPVLSELAIIILFVICPIVLILCLILLFWAKYKDKKDANNILKGALARIKLMRIMKNRQKRLFFDNIKLAQVETMMNVHDLNLNQGQNSARQLEKARKIHRLYLFRQFFLAVKYEHSLFGLTRYDPNFSRVQRVLIFISVLISNFGAAALIFELRNETYEFSIVFIVGVSFFAAFLVSIPLKVIGRALFKTTENKSGSKEDQVNSMYKIITRMETADGTESQKDQSLVEAIHDLHIAEQRVKKVASLGRQNTYSSAFAESANSSGLEDKLPYAVYLDKKKSLNEATLSARGAWKEAKYNKEMSGKFYSSWGRIKSLRTQSNSFIKVASLVSGEPQKNARPRENRLPNFTLFINYFFVGLVVAFYVFYIVIFVGTRQERAEDGFPDNENLDIVPLTEEEYMIQWAIGGVGGILVSYLVAEPLVALIRYVILPYIIITCGRKKIPDDFDEEMPAEWIKEKGTTKNIREGYSHIGFDLAADLFENLF